MISSQPGDAGIEDRILKIEDLWISLLSAILCSLFFRAHGNYKRQVILHFFLSVLVDSRSILVGWALPTKFR